MSNEREIINPSNECPVKSPLIINPIVHYDPAIARKLGINAAIILSRIIWSINQKIKENQAKFLIEDNWWMYDSVAAFCHYSGMSRDNFYTALKKLQAENLINIEKIHKKTLDHTNHYSVNFEEYWRLFPDYREHSQSNVGNPDNRISETSTIECRESRQSNVGNPDNVTKNHTKSLSKGHTKSLGGNARAREEEAPPSQNVILFPKEKPPQSEDIESEIIRVQDELNLLWQEIENAEVLGEVLPPERLKRWDELSQSIKDLLHTRDSNKKAPPTASKDVRDLWHRHAKETFKTSLFPIEKYNTAIDEILSKTGYTENDIAVIFSHIVSGKDRLLTSRFKFPWEWNKSWESQNPESLNYLDEAYSSMNARKAKWK